MIFATNNRPQGASFALKRLGLLQDTKSGITRLYLSSVDVMNIEEIHLDEKVDIVSLIAKTCKVEGAIGITWRRQIPTLFFFDTDTDPNLKSKSVVPPSCRSCIKRFNVPPLRIANKKPLELQGVVLQHVNIGDLEVLLRLGAVNELLVDILVGTSFKDR